MTELLSSPVFSTTNIWSFLAIACTAAALIIVRLKVHRFKELLKRIDKLPETDRLKAVKEELNQVPPPNLSAEQYIKFKSQPYNFTFKCLIALLITGLVAMTLITLYPSPKSINNPPPPTPTITAPDLAIDNIALHQGAFTPVKLPGHLYNQVSWSGLFKITNLTDRPTTIENFVVGWKQVKLKDGTPLSLEEIEEGSNTHIETYDNLSDINDISGDSGKTREEINKIQNTHTQVLPIPFLAHEQKYINIILLFRIVSGTNVISQADMDTYDNYLAASLDLPRNERNQIQCSFSQNAEVQLTTPEGKLKKGINNTWVVIPNCVVKLEDQSGQPYWQVVK